LKLLCGPADYTAPLRATKPTSELVEQQLVYESSARLKRRRIRRDLFDRSPDQQNVVLIDGATIQKAQRMIGGGEACSEDAEIPFDNILDRLTGCNPSVTDYFLVLARCHVVAESRP
jgi:hypothetical protein